MKRIIILCDGTGNSASRDRKEINTNVKRLSDAIAPKYNIVLCHDKTHDLDDSGVCHTEGCEHVGKRGEEDDQIVYYQSGVGTAQYGSLYAGGTGAGINDNILDAYHFLASNHQKGDEIFIFGFSRGAYTARVVANLVQQLGIFYKSRLWMMRKAWIQYKKDDNGKSFEHFCKNLWEVDPSYTKPAVVKVLGVWDTVGCVGKPDYVPGALNSEKYYQTSILEGGVEFVFHALAVDEYRRTFGPTMFFMPKTGEKRTYNHVRAGKSEGVRPVLTAKSTVLKQCWLPGVHSNVGGSYVSEHIADIAIAWMIDQCLVNGHLLNFDKYALFRLVDRHLHPEKNLDSFHAGAPRKYPGFGAGTVYDSFKGSKWYVTWQYRAPGNYIRDEAHPGRGNTDHPGRYSAWSFPSWSDMTSWFRSTPTAKDYCTDPTCCHPAKKGKYDLDPITGLPLIDALPPGATAESIHGSMYARYVASVAAAQKEKEFRLKESQRQLAVTVDNPKESDEDKALPTSLLDWDPESLAPFRTGEKHDPAKLNRYMRKPLSPGGPIVWTGRCLRSGKLFEILEEQDQLSLPEENSPAEQKHYDALGPAAVAKRHAQLAANRQYNRRAVGPMMRRLNTAGAGALPNPNPYDKPASADEAARRKAEEEAFAAMVASETEGERKARVEREAGAEEERRYQEWVVEKKRYMDHAYLQEGFEIEELEKVLRERERAFEEGRPDPRGGEVETEEKGVLGKVKGWFGF